MFRDLRTHGTRRRTQRETRSLCIFSAGAEMLGHFGLLRKQRRRRAGPADQTAHVRAKRQIVPGAADIESKLRDFLPRLGLADGRHGYGMQIEPALAEIHGAAKPKSEARVFELAFLDAGYAL